MYSVGKVGGASGSASGAVAYYMTGDYYTKDAENVGRWNGAGAERLGVAGIVDEDGLKNALEGKFDSDLDTTWDPDDPPDNRRLGFDFTFTPPKSVSVMALVAGDDRIMKAIDQANQKGMEYLETYAISRQRDENGAYTFEKTGSLTWATFRESTSRALDPNAHNHNVVLNATVSEKEGKIVSLYAREVYRAMKAADRVAKADLARSIKAMGHDIVVDKAAGSFEIAGVAESTNALYSKMNDKIQSMVAEKGLEGPAEVDREKMRLRPDKEKITEDQLVDRWRDELQTQHELTGEGQTPEDLDRLRDAAAGRDVYEKASAVREALDYGLAHALATEAVVEERAVVKEALNHGMGSVTIDDLRDEIAKREKDRTLVRTNSQSGSRLIVNGITTPQALALERKLVEAIETSKGAVKPLSTALSADKALSPFRVKTPTGPMPLSDEQRQSAIKIMTTSDRLVVVQGTAGAGKTEMIGALMQALPAAGHLAVAPTNQVVEGIREKTGIEAMTVHKLVLTQARDVKPGTLVYADESSMVDTKLAADLLTLAAKRDFRIVTIGDSRQLPSIGAGRSHETSLEVATSIARMPTAYRQRPGSQADMVTKAVKLGQRWQENARRFRDGETKEEPGENPFSGVTAALGSDLHVIPGKGPHGKPLSDRDVRAAIVEAVSNSYLADKDEDKGAVLVLDNAARRDINTKVREGLVKEGAIDAARQVEATVLAPNRMNSIETKVAWAYKKDDIVVAGKAIERYGIKKNDSFSVKGTKGEHKIVLTNERTGKQLTLDPRSKDVEGFSLHRREPRNIAPGDKIIMTKQTRGLANATQATVSAMDGMKATLDIGKGKTVEIDVAKNEHWDHAYAITTMRAQGASMNVSRLVMMGKDAGNMHAKQLNTGATRARERVEVHTDNWRGVLSAAAQDEGRKTLASEALKRDGHDLKEQRGRFVAADAKELTVSQIVSQRIAEANKRVNEMFSQVKVANAKAPHVPTPDQEKRYEKEASQAKEKEAARAEQQKRDERLGKETAKVSPESSKAAANQKQDKAAEKVSRGFQR